MEDNEKILLEERIFKSNEMAKWFGISTSTYYHNKQKKLEELANYCEFKDLDKKGIKITKVIMPEYIKRTAKSTVNKHFDEAWASNGENLNTCKNTATYIYDKYSDELNAKFSTVYNATCM